MKSLPTIDLRLHSALLNKALGLLVHPLTLFALALLLVNDHVLRHLWPSTLTGKLGDFAWLFFSPLVLIAALALIVPSRSRALARIVPALSYAAVVVIFGLAKTVPVAHRQIVSFASQLMGFEVGWRLDPTDLIALISVAASAYLWAKMAERKVVQASLSLGTAGVLRLRCTPLRTPAVPELRDTRVVPPHLESAPGAAGWVVLVAAALLTVANSPAPDPGIFCLEERAGEVDAHSAYATFRSVDGGLTWESLPNQPQGACPNPWGDPAGASMITVDPNDEARQYRITPGKSIEYSEDGGASWRVVYEIAEVNEATAAATRKRLSSNAMMRPVPLDGKVDRATGNAIFAMGYSGVLVQEAGSGAWREVAVGTYRPLAVNSVTDFLSLLLGEILLATAVAFLALCTLTTRIVVRGKALWIIVLAVAWLIWAATVFLFPPAMSYGYGVILTYGAMLILGVILLIMTIIALVGSLQQTRTAGKGSSAQGSLRRRLLTALTAGALFLLPYALWVAGGLPQYYLAAVFGALLAVSAIVAGAIMTRERHSDERQEDAQLSYTRPDAER